MRRKDTNSADRGAARRTFLKTIPAAMAAGLAAPALARQESQAQTQRISRETLDCAEKIFGVDFTDEQEQQALAGVTGIWMPMSSCARWTSRSIPSRLSHSDRICPARSRSLAPRPEQGSKLR